MKLLQITPEADSPLIFPLPDGPDARVTLGVDAAVDLVVPYHPSRRVARRHCTFFTLGQELIVADLGSSVPTLVNGEAIREAPLRPGDRLGIGEAYEFLVVP